jgi:hypothetical protein
VTRIYCTDHFVLPVPEGPRFPMRNYALLRERVAAVAGGCVTSIDDIVDIHFATVALALQRFHGRPMLDFDRDEQRHRPAHA